MAGAAPPFALGAVVDGANVRGVDVEEPFDDAGPGSKDGAVLAGLGITVPEDADGAVHDEQPEPVLKGAEFIPLIPLTPHVPQALDEP